VTSEGIVSFFADRLPLRRTSLKQLKLDFIPTVSPVEIIVKLVTASVKCTNPENYPADHPWRSWDTFANRFLSWFAFLGAKSEGETSFSITRSYGRAGDTESDYRYYEEADLIENLVVYPAIRSCSNSNGLELCPGAISIPC
jgi:hypothetical protein